MSNPSSTGDQMFRPVRLILATPEFTTIVWRQEPQYSFPRNRIIRLEEPANEI